MKRALIKSAVCFLTAICLLLNSYPISSGVRATDDTNEILINYEDSQIPPVVYSNDKNVGFEDIGPMYPEDCDHREIVVSRWGEISSPLSVTVKVYDNSAEYGSDYTLSYGGKEIEKIEGATSVFNAFRDNGLLSSRLPIDAADLYVSYAESTDQTEAVNAAQMLGQLEELGALAAEFDICFGSGEAVTSIDVNVIDDDESEYSETFVVVLIGNDGNMIENSQILCTLNDNEEAPTVHVDFASVEDIKANEQTGIAQIEFKRSGNLATGTNAVLLQNEIPIGYVGFTPHQEKQVVLALPGTYRLASDGEYTVGNSQLTVTGEVTDIVQLPEGADPVLDALPGKYESMSTAVQGAPSKDKFAEWARGGAYENEKEIVIMGDSSNGLFVKDGSSTDGNMEFLNNSNMYQLDTEGGASNGYLYACTTALYNLYGIESIEGTVYVDDLTTGYCDVLFGVLGVGTEGRTIIHTNDNDSTQNLVQKISPGWGLRHIFYCNHDLNGLWDCGWNAYFPNGFKMNKRVYNIFIMQPEPLDYCGSEFAPSIVAGRNKMSYTMHSNRQIDIAYTCDSAHPARLIGYKFYNAETNQYSNLISLSDSNIAFDQAFVQAYDTLWGYFDADQMRTFTILPVFEKIEVDASLKSSALGTLKLESPTDQICKGDTLVFSGEGNDSFPFAGVSYQCRKSAGSEVLAHGVVFKVGDTATFELSHDYGHYTFQGVFNTSTDTLSVNYGDEDPKGQLAVSPGVVLSGSDYRLSDYYPLMAKPDEGYITVWESNNNYYFGDIFSYQLDGNYLNHDISVRFLAEGELLDPNDGNSKITLSAGTLSGRLTRNDMNLFDGTNVDIPLGNTMYTVTTSHGTHSGYTDENGYYSIEDFKGVIGGTYSMAVNYQNRIGYATFEYNGGGDYDLSLPQFAVGGFYPVEVTATVSGQGYGSNTLNLTSEGTVQMSAKIYIHTEEYKITGVKFHFLSTLNENYGDELKVLEAAFNENAQLGDKYELWTLDLSNTSYVPKDTRIYVSVTAEYAYEPGDPIRSTTDLVNSGYIVKEALNEDTVPVWSAIPEIPGVQVSSTDPKNFDIPIVGVLDMSCSSKTGGYFVQQGSSKNEGDVYVLLCGHSIEPNVLTGTLKQKYESAMETYQKLQVASNNTPHGLAKLKQKCAKGFEIVPVFMFKLTYQTVKTDTGELGKTLVAFEAAVGTHGYYSANIPVSLYGIPAYLGFYLNGEIYIQVEQYFKDKFDPTNAQLENIVKDFSQNQNSDLNAYLSAPLVNFSVKGGVGVNGFISIFAEGAVSTPFMIDVTVPEAAGLVSFRFSIGADLAMFSTKMNIEPVSLEYGPESLLNDLHTIQGFNNLAYAYTVESGETFTTMDEAVNHSRFSVMERPKPENSILGASGINHSVLAKGVFKNTKIKLVELDSGKIMALFLIDNHAPDGCYNYLSAAYAISDDKGKTWSNVEYISQNIGTATSSFQYDINVFELEDRLLVTWSEADLDEMLQNMDPNDLTAAQMAQIVNAMNLQGRFFDRQSGKPISDSFVIAENSAVFCGALDAIQNGENVYVYYQRNALSTHEDTTFEDILSADRTIALAAANVGSPESWTSYPVRAMTQNGGQYRIVEVEPFVHDGILGEIMVLDRNGLILNYDYESQENVPNIEDRQLYLRTYTFDENGAPITASFQPLTNASETAQSPQVVSNKDYLYLFWNNNGEIVYASDFVATPEDDEITKSKALVIGDATGHTLTNHGKFSATSIAGDESLHVGTTFTVSMTDSGRVLICWIGTDTNGGDAVPTDEIFGIMLETKSVSEVFQLAGIDSSNADDTEHQLWAVGSPVRLTDENSVIGALDSICFESGEESKFLLAYTRLDKDLRGESTYADVFAMTSTDRPELSVEVEFPQYPMPGKTETAHVTIRNEGIHALEGYTLTVSGIGEEIVLTNGNLILPGRNEELFVQIPVPDNFASEAILRVSVSGIGTQSQYAAYVETEALYGSYFVPTTIPSISAIPNSDNCVITVYVKNIGNAPGMPHMTYVNRIYASDNEDDIKTYHYDSEIMVTPKGEAAIDFTMNDTLIGREDYSAVQVHLGDQYDQSTQIPMPKPVDLAIDDVLNDLPNEPEDPTDPSDPEDPTDPSDPEDTPPTGDTNSGIVLAIMMTAAFGASICLIPRRKRSAK